jgi:serine protease inhibitor
VFPAEATEPADFYPPDGAAVQAMMMKRSGYFLYAGGENWQAVKLPYGEGQMEMTVILPGVESSLQELRRSLWMAASRWMKDSAVPGERSGCRGLPRATGQNLQRSFRPWA